MSNQEEENQQLLGFYAGVGEELTLHFDELKTEFYVAYSAAPSGCWELYRAKTASKQTKRSSSKSQCTKKSDRREEKGTNQKIKGCF